MKYICKLTIDSNGYEHYIGVNCFSLKHIIDYYCLDYLKGEEELLNYYKNMDMNDIINQIKDKIIKKHGGLNAETKQIIKKIKHKSKTITIEI
jgi:hypothetical protein